MRDDLRITPDNDGVGVVAAMTPAPNGRLSQNQEAGDLVDDIVHPAGAKGGAVTALVPTRVRGAAVEHAVGDEDRHGPPGGPGEHTEDAEPKKEDEPQGGVPQCWPVGPRHQLFHLLAWD